MGNYGFSSLVIPVIFIIVIVIVIAIGVYFGVRRLSNVDNSPIETAFGKVIAKRTEVKSYGDDNVKTLYFITIEFENGIRKEFKVEGKLYGLTREKDNGKLTIKGTALLDIETQREPLKPKISYCEHCSSVFENGAVICKSCGAPKRK